MIRKLIIINIINMLLVVFMAGFMLACDTANNDNNNDKTKADKGSTPQTGGMMGGTGQMSPTPPPVKGYAEGEEILFIHTEASDSNVAQMLTGMMSSLVLIVPSLAQAPESMLANVYVFTNGVKGEGPFGFQSDVFDNPPAAEGGYRPLRLLHKVAWKNERSARLLKSAAEVKEAKAKDEVTIEQTKVVINMPMLTWPGGRR